ncbi:hypothetical protein GVAV_001690 [Gurleya vavrai]
MVGQTNSKSTGSGNIQTTLASAAMNQFSYDGSKEEDLQLFIEDVQQYIAIHNLNERQATYLIRFALKNEAKTWARTIDMETSFDHFLIFLNQRFQTQEHQIYYYRLLNKKCQYTCENKILSYMDKLRFID